MAGADAGSKREVNSVAVVAPDDRRAYLAAGRSGIEPLDIT